MPLRSGDHGYGALAKTLHWLTVVALVAQFTIGYLLDVDDSGHGRGRGRGRGGESGRGRGRGGDDDGGYLDDPGTLLTVHVLLGVADPHAGRGPGGRAHASTGCRRGPRRCHTGSGRWRTGPSGPCWCCSSWSR